MPSNRNKCRKKHQKRQEDYIGGIGCAGISDQATSILHGQSSLHKDLLGSYAQLEQSMQ